MERRAAALFDVIEVEDLTFRYVGRKQPALRHVSFSCARGEVLLVLGPSGCGKSTLALCLNGAIPHSIAGEWSGQVRIGGVDAASASMAELAQQVGLVFQDPEAQFCMLRVADEVAFGLENLAVPAGEMDARIDTALAQVGLLDRRSDRIDRLSGGQKQRLALACVLVQGPSVLVLDEPTAQLDPAGAAELVALLGRLRTARRHTLILVEHRLDEIMHLVDRVLVLSASGAVVALGPPRDVLQAHGNWLLDAGVWVPQVSELALRLREPRMPLTVEEAAATISYRARDALVDGAPGDGQGETPTPALSQTTEVVVKVEHLSHRYAGIERLALDDVSFDVRGGELVAMAGGNGAGKSTLARLVAGILKRQSGVAAARGRVGYVFQYPEHQFVGSTALEDVAYGAGRDAPEVALAMLTELGLAALAEAHPFSLSLGEQRRLSIADMLVIHPAVLILDEPTFGQDRANTEKLIVRMQALADDGLAVLAITHDVKLIARTQRVLALAEGRLIFDGSPRHLFANEGALRQASLIPPPLWQLSQRLGLVEPLTEVAAFRSEEHRHEVLRLA